MWFNSNNSAKSQSNVRHRYHNQPTSPTSNDHVPSKWPMSSSTSPTSATSGRYHRKSSSHDLSHPQPRHHHQRTLSASHSIADMMRYQEQNNHQQQHNHSHSHRPISTGTIESFSHDGTLVKIMARAAPIDLPAYDMIYEKQVPGSRGEDLGFLLTNEFLPRDASSKHPFPPRNPPSPSGRGKRFDSRPSIYSHLEQDTPDSPSMSVIFEELDELERQQDALEAQRQREATRDWPFEDYEVLVFGSSSNPILKNLKHISHPDRSSSQRHPGADPTFQQKSQSNGKNLYGSNLQRRSAIKLSGSSQPVPSRKRAESAPSTVLSQHVPSVHVPHRPLPPIPQERIASVSHQKEHNVYFPPPPTAPPNIPLPPLPVKRNKKLSFAFYEPTYSMLVC